ncbi:CheW domain-containing protein [Pseudomonas sp. MPC6]|uniref:CheW domain-containing protein n=1 Tax=unclassified Pseudomonas TaxID=196821 RepID=UPI001110916D|nr:CheW domain-containing protein [Pseudomonas sp. MPC6]QCY13908.1 CheW domain-containing protein [Pseudomonas sp. MPC6]
MNRPAKITSRPQLALQSYLDNLLMDATDELTADVPEVVEDDSALDEFQAAVLEEQALDAQKAVVAATPVLAALANTPVMIDAAPTAVPAAVSSLAPPPQTLVPPVVDVHQAPGTTPPTVGANGRPSWAAEPFECLLFDVAGLTLAVPLVCLGSIYSLAGHELTPLFGQPDWFLGILPSQAGNLKVLDTARWVMPDRYRDDFRQGLQYVISVQGYEWGLAVHQVSRSLRLDPNEIKWRSHRGQRPWLAGTVIEHMCALLDVTELAELIASGGAKHMGGSKAGPT